MTMELSDMDLERVVGGKRHKPTPAPKSEKLLHPAVVTEPTQTANRPAQSLVGAFASAVGTGAGGGCPGGFCKKYT